MIIKKCKCGSTNFIIDEALVWNAELDEDGQLTTYKTSNSEIQTIICTNCNKEYLEENFKQINFN